MDLEQFGYDAHFQVQFEALEGAQVVARIAVAHGESYVAWTKQGPCKAILVGRFMTSDRAAVDRPQVGDWVAGAHSESRDALLIEHLLTRRTCLMRKAIGKPEAAQVLAANVDVVGIVSVFGARLDARDWLVSERRIRRYLAAVEQSRAAPLLIVNKSDLTEEPASVAATLGRLFPDVPVVVTSASRRIGLDSLARWLQPRTTLALVGASGVGKSTLVNALLNRAAQRTGNVRAGDASGRHTTSHRELFVMESGALLLDMPGTREFDLWEAEGSTTESDEVSAIAAKCRFSDCRHLTEPGCAIRAALQAGDLSAERLVSQRPQGKPVRHRQGRPKGR